MTKSKPNDKINPTVKLPLLSLKITNFNLDNVFLILQGVSRYVSSIIFGQELVENEGFEVLNFLQSRYPSKKIILDISDKTEIDTFVKTVVQKTKIKFFVVSSQDYSVQFHKLCQFIQENNKVIIFSGNKIDLDFLQKFKIDHVFYYRFSKKGAINWNSHDFEQIEFLCKNNIFVTVGDLDSGSIKKFSNIWIDEFLIGKEICYSFNPVQTCKLIYSEIKQTYLSYQK